MRKLIAGMQLSLDGKMGGPDGFADWVDNWSDHYGFTSRVDACVLGAGMYPGYEQYWSTIQSAPTAPLPMTGKRPAPEEVEYAGFAARTPHYVLSSTLSTTQWSHTSFLRSVEAVRALKQGSGKDIYLVGGARIVASLLDVGLIDELKVDFYPLIVGKGMALFEATELRHGLELRDVSQLPGGRVSLTYAITNAAAP